MASRDGMVRLRRVLAKYSPDQPRDSHGRFGSGGGGDKVEPSSDRTFTKTVLGTVLKTAEPYDPDAVDPYWETDEGRAVWAAAVGMRKYSPDQPRDARGRFGSGSGDGAVSSEPEHIAFLRRHVEAFTAAGGTVERIDKAWQTDKLEDDLKWVQASRPGPSAPHRLRMGWSEMRNAIVSAQGKAVDGLLVARDGAGHPVAAISYDTLGNSSTGVTDIRVGDLGSIGRLAGAATALEVEIARMGAEASYGVHSAALTDAISYHEKIGRDVTWDGASSSWTKEQCQQIADAFPTSTVVASKVALGRLVKDRVSGATQEHGEHGRFVSGGVVEFVLNEPAGLQSVGSTSDGSAGVRPGWSEDFGFEDPAVVMHTFRPVTNEEGYRGTFGWVNRHDDGTWSGSVDDTDNWRDRGRPGNWQRQTHSTSTQEFESMTAAMDWVESKYNERPVVKDAQSGKTQPHGAHGHFASSGGTIEDATARLGREMAVDPLADPNWRPREPVKVDARTIADIEKAVFVTGLDIANFTNPASAYKAAIAEDLGQRMQSSTEDMLATVRPMMNLSTMYTIDPETGHVLSGIHSPVSSDGAYLGEYIKLSNTGTPMIGKILGEDTEAQRQAFDRAQGWVRIDSSKGDRMLRQFAVGQMVHQWAETSNDSDPDAWAMQDAAQRVFGLDDAAQWDHSHDHEPPPPTFDLDNPSTAGVLEDFVRSQHEATMAMFADYGIGPDDTVTLYRGEGRTGTTSVEGESTLKAIAGETVDATFRPMTSWTLSPDTARGADFTDNFEAVMVREVPVRDVIGTYLTGVGCASESEFVLKGGVSEVRITKNGDTLRPYDFIPKKTATVIGTLVKDKTSGETQAHGTHGWFTSGGAQPERLPPIYQAERTSPSTGKPLASIAADSSMHDPGLKGMPAKTMQAVVDRLSSTAGVTAEQATANVVDMFNKSSTETREFGAPWYSQAHEFNGAMARQYGLDEHVVTGITAALSPGQFWDSNQMGTRSVCAAFAEPDKVITQDLADKFNAKDDGVRHGITVEAGETFGKYLNDPDTTRAASILIAVDTHMGIGKSYDNLDKAVAMARENDPSMINDTLGGAKVRSFFNNMEDPTGPDVTVDIHMMRAMVNGDNPAGEHYIDGGHDRIRTVNDQVNTLTSTPSFHGASVGAYPVMADVVRAATAQINEANGTTYSPSQVQAIVWGQQLQDYDPARMVAVNKGKE